MHKYKKYNWEELLAEFDASGLTQTQFCKERDINPRYFSLQRSKLLKENKGPDFQRVDVQAPATTGLTIQVGRCRVVCPESMPITAFAQLVHSLA